jgi:hypothetical protein
MRSTVVAAGLLFAAATAACERSRIPDALDDRAFWALSESLSEPPGSFPLSDNLVSNEPRLAENARWIRRRGGVYIGVGPEQNFTYIASLRPSTAFIIDIRRENRSLHLLYKALFEISQNRADFVSRLFSRARPASRRSNARELFATLAAQPPSEELRHRTLALVRERLLGAHGLPLSQSDLDWIEQALYTFYRHGPDVHFWSSRPGAPDTVRPSYRQLMTTLDQSGQERSFLSADEAFAFVKDLHARNKIVPVIGDFGGPATIRAIGQTVREQGDVVRAFYASNVAVYLTNQQMGAFCASLATLPAAPGAWFIESDAVRSFHSKLVNCQPGPVLLWKR